MLVATSATPRGISSHGIGVAPRPAQVANRGVLPTLPALRSRLQGRCSLVPEAAGNRVVALVRVLGF